MRNEVFQLSRSRQIPWAVEIETDSTGMVAEIVEDGAAAGPCVHWTSLVEKAHQDAIAFVKKYLDVK